MINESEKSLSEIMYISEVLNQQKEMNEIAQKIVDMTSSNDVLDIEDLFVISFELINMDKVLQHLKLDNEDIL